MTPHPLEWLWPLAFFFVGLIPMGYLLGKMKGIDIRQHGSGNIGATNVWRVLGRNWGLPAFIFDFLKGFLPLFLLRVYVIEVSSSWQTALLLVICGLAAIIGHNYTPWLGFKGGKGIATSAGVLAALMPPVLAVALSLWIISTALTRMVSVGSILAALSLVPLTLVFLWRPMGLFSRACRLLAAVLAIVRHKTNIKRLLNGTESRIEFGSKKKKS